MAKEYLAQKIAKIAAQIEGLPTLSADEIQLGRPKKGIHGDLSTNVAMVLAKKVGKDPMAIAEAISQKLRLNRGLIKNWSVCAPGFINFVYGGRYLRDQLLEIHLQGKNFGKSDIGKGQKVQVEFVSANPTGPLNVVNARAAAVGDSIANLLQAVGYHVEREYYVNDTGLQVKLLAESVEVRYRQLLGETVSFPEDGYHGEYIIDLAREIIDQKGVKYLSPPTVETREKIRHEVLHKLVSMQQEDLRRFGVEFDVWFSERNLKKSGVLEEVLALLTEGGHIYEKDRAVWFCSSSFYDQEDRVLIKEDGEATYFLLDTAYHKNKFDRGFHRVIDLWGPDHHGYVPRMRSAVKALGIQPDLLDLRIIQQVNLLRGGKPIRMSKREGSLISMRELLDEVGVDVARFFFLMRRMDSHLDFDMDVAAEESEENPVYYVQYAHARCCSILKYSKSQGAVLSPIKEVDLSLLKRGEELDLIKEIALLPEIMQGAAQALEPHRITGYLRDVATAFHHFYHKHRVVTDSSGLTAARLALVEATRIVLRNALRIIGVSAPTSM
jgi:arginyl-tRNA synthetase